MPSSLTLNINSQIDAATAAAQAIKSGQTSPLRPPYSPLTPTCCDSYQGSNAASFRTKVVPPALKPINFHDNPDVLALKSTISILQTQKKTAINDIKTLQRIKMRALQNPQEFARALFSGEIKTRSDPLLHPEYACDYFGDKKVVSSSSKNHECSQSVANSWEKLPMQQNIVRSPPINFAKYAVVSESLDKLHCDQIARPSEGVPQHLGAGGEYIKIDEGSRRQYDMGVAAPYNPFRDKICKVERGVH
ncbi:hypothetical protein OnM2_032069 [Erysiphe neolycopersici]|uniref:Uncharacterized protein n=1 Tax=Erysiphe neolycopersici TaxID=212602 RepID=A0A420HYR3_9PEZI|nr:hypothetical protein OnM2_032069 [Erysiphe neolycopersici]